MVMLVVFCIFLNLIAWFECLQNLFGKINLWLNEPLTLSIEVKHVHRPVFE